MKNSTYQFMKAFWLSISNIRLLYLYTENAIVITFVNIHWQCIVTSADKLHYYNLQSEVQHKVLCRSFSIKYQSPNCITYHGKYPLYWPVQWRPQLYWGPRWCTASQSRLLVDEPCIYPTGNPTSTHTVLSPQTNPTGKPATQRSLKCNCVYNIWRA